MSYLAWPVSINGNTQTEDNKFFHLTFKFFGRTDISSDLIRKLLKGQDVSPITESDSPRWQLQVWKRFKHEFSVLALENPPKRIIMAHDAFHDLKADDFPVYRPHIAIPPLWAQALQSGGCESLKIEMGPLMLMGLQK